VCPLQLNEDISRINSRMKAAIDSAEASLAFPAAAGTSDSILKARKVGDPLSVDADVSNPHRGPTALQRAGIVKNYATISSKTVALVGLGSVGAAAADLLARSGALPLLCSS
jgi:lactate dehydrogenase-like 2-hydroxyacid dehydrogenase